MPDINPDKVCFVIVKAREFDVQDEASGGKMILQRERRSFRERIRVGQG